MKDKIDLQQAKTSPLFGICGFSGSGKTTLIEAVVPKLRAQDMKILVIKHDVHNIDLDLPGKDSDRIFRAGADVILQGDETFIRLHKNSSPDLSMLVHHIGKQYDLILVEGHKQMSIPKVWLLSEGEEQPPTDITKIKAVLPRNEEERVKSFMKVMNEWLLLSSQE